METVQNHPAPIVPTSTTTSSISTPRRWVRRSISNNDLIVSIDRVTDRLAECQLLVDSISDQSRASDEFPVLTKPLQPSDLLGHIVQGGQILIW